MHTYIYIYIYTYVHIKIYWLLAVGRWLGSGVGGQRSWRRWRPAVAAAAGQRQPERGQTTAINRQPGGRTIIHFVFAHFLLTLTISLGLLRQLGCPSPARPSWCGPAGRPSWPRQLGWPGQAAALGYQLWVREYIVLWLAPFYDHTAY